MQVTKQHCRDSTLYRRIWGCPLGESVVMVEQSTRPVVADSAPSEACVTDYDRAHFTTYLRLLDAAAEGAPWADVARIVLEIDAAKEPDRAKTVYESHLARARWMKEHGYRDLLRGKTGQGIRGDRD